MQADRGQPDPADDDRRFAGLSDQPAQDRVRMAHQLLAADGGAGPDEQLGPQAVRPLGPVDEPELDKRSQVAVDGRDRHVEGRSQLVRSDLSPVGHDEEQPQAAGEGGVLRGFLRGPIPGGRHGRAGW